MSSNFYKFKLIENSWAQENKPVGVSPRGLLVDDLCHQDNVLMLVNCFNVKLIVLMLVTNVNK